MAQLLKIIGACAALITIYLFIDQLIPDDEFIPALKSGINLPAAKNEDQSRSIGLMGWWENNSQEFLRTKGQIDSVKYLSVWSQHFDRGRVIYNQADGWAVIASGGERSYRKVDTPGDALITSGHGNSHIETEVLDSYLSESKYSQEEKEKIVNYIKQRTLLGGIGTLFIRENLLPELGWPSGSEFIEEEVILGESIKYFVFIGLQNRPGDNKTKCVIRFDKIERNYTKQTNVVLDP